MLFVICVVAVIVLYVVVRGTKKGSFVDERDGQKYRTVKIGNQVWMAENLNYEIDNSWCYNNDESNGEKYGRLYTWEAAKAACPAGWHVPSCEEWDDLTSAAGGKKVAGKKLKAKSGWDFDTVNSDSGDGTDKYGFSALPGGEKSFLTGFGYEGETGIWWTSDTKGDGDAYYRDMNSAGNNVHSYYGCIASGLSVRCIKDKY